MSQTRALVRLGSQLWSWGPGIHVPSPTPPETQDRSPDRVSRSGLLMSLPGWHQLPRPVPEPILVVPTLVAQSLLIADFLRAYALVRPSEGPE